MRCTVSHVRVRYAGSTKKAQRQGPRPGIGRLDDGLGLGLLVVIKRCGRFPIKTRQKMKLQLFCVAAAALIQSAFVASHEVPSFRGVSLLDDAKDAAAVSLYSIFLIDLSSSHSHRVLRNSRSQVAPVKPAETDTPEQKDELADETAEKR